MMIGTFLFSNHRKIQYLLQKKQCVWLIPDCKGAFSLRRIILTVIEFGGDIKAAIGSANGYVGE
jgi:hypothetical protein